MTARRASRPQRRDPERTKTRLLQAAIKLFAARGYDGVAVDEVVAAARVNKRMVYHYFGSKDELYLAALTEVFSRLELVELQAMDTSIDPVEQLRRLLTAYFEFLDANPEFVRMLLWENLQQGDRIARQPQRFAKNPFLDRLSTLLDEGVRNGTFREPVDRRHLAVNFIGLCFIYYSNRFSLSASLGLDFASGSQRRIRVEQALDLVFHGLGVRERTSR
jgi:AcrR family transcriptional regulator